MAPLQHNAPSPGVSGRAGLAGQHLWLPAVWGRLWHRLVASKPFLLTSGHHLLQGPVTATRTRWKPAAEGSVGAILVTFCYSVITLLKEGLLEAVEVGAELMDSLKFGRPLTGIF